MGRGPWPGAKKQYGTLDARCNACRIYGGIEDPCQGAGILNAIRKKYKRACPRVELKGENHLAGTIAILSLGESAVSRELLGLVIKRRLRYVDDEQKIAILSRVTSALGHPKVLELTERPDPSAVVLRQLLSTRA